MGTAKGKYAGLAWLVRYRFWRPSFAVAAMSIVITWPCDICAGQTSHGHRHEVAQSEHGLGEASRVERRREQIMRVLSLSDYNTRIVLIGTGLLGISAGVVGPLVVLRKRALVADVISHASLPGIAIAFLTMEMIEPGSGKSLPGLLCGATVGGLTGVAFTAAIRRWTRIREDASLAIVLSIFFGLGIALFTVIQNIPTGNAAGLQHFIYGKAASMVADDVRLIAGTSLVVLVLCGLLFKELTLLAFDQRYAAVQGWPVLLLDAILMTLVVAVTVVGLQSVGLLLVVALLIVPAAAARFWTHHLPRLTLASAAIGGLSAMIGVAVSALYPRLAAGAVIVLVGSAMFVVSMFLGTRRGVLRRMFMHRRLARRVGEQHLLRAFFESTEDTASAGAATFGDLLTMRSWTPRQLQRQLALAQRQGLIDSKGAAGYGLTRRGLEEARRVARNHRLWELYLIRYADIAPTHVDRDADQIEHVLSPELIDELELALEEQDAASSIPSSPHAIGPVAAVAPGAR